MYIFSFVLYDCDLFTRNYFKENFQIVQGDPIKIEKPVKVIIAKVIITNHIYSVIVLYIHKCYKSLYI